MADVSILVPNYKTEQLTKICLRLLRKHTDPTRIRVIAVDNHSRDASTEYLRSLSWIELIERQPEPDDTPSLSHSRALDMALARVDTPYVLSIHTDTFVYRDDWLDYLLAPFQANPDVAGVGSWKLEVKPPLRRAAKAIEDYWQRKTYPLRGRPLPEELVEGHYLRSHCAIYRTDLIREYGLSFSADRDTAGRKLHQALVAKGHEMVFLPAPALMRYMLHLNHATMVLNPELGSRSRSIRKGLKRIEQGLKTIQAERVLADVSLDA
ncbi:glycosyltransferase [Alkalilimnicola sp. S0819]|uniref:glycosyltransferase n=1 Tax=Alkalilimnicola sp. S0819 TaxID=2613922 RepID=UPI001261CF95|nr:glycosyltransferase [Alkalilimnicola sp. S0819]KAB7627331.1 glycosyltransferase [Alkalilimnicola sp. S0819]MPQ16047.1 glycosyltransferase [Alkalilimnicola sp. S0819]